MRKKQDSAFEAIVQAAVTGYEINVMDIGKVYNVAEHARDNGQDITLAIHGLLNVIARKVE